MAMKIISVTDIEDFEIGNAENSEKGTGCTVIICKEGAVGGVDVRGGGPATRETDLLRSENTVNAVNAVVLSGGSAFGLEAASGVMRELADMKIGFDVGDDIVVPIVCGASLYDLPVGDKAFPDINMGIQAVRNAFEGSFSNGNHGAGTGATVGKLKGYDRAMKSGLGTFACGDGVIKVGAIAAVNAVGDIYNGAGNIIAGLRSEDGSSIYGTIKTLKNMVHDNIPKKDEGNKMLTKADIEEALAAAAKQYKEEEAHTEEAVTRIIPEEPSAESETVYQEPDEQAVAEFVFQNPAEEEPVAEAVIEITDENEEEFIPETPVIDTSEESCREYAEISIPAAAQDYTEIREETPADQKEEIIESNEDESAPAEEIIEEPAEELSEQAVEIVEEPAEELSEQAEEIIEESAEELSEQAEEIIEEPAEELSEQAEEIIEEPAEELSEQAVEIVEEPAEEPAPVPEIFAETEEETKELTREDMGYDIVFNTTISCLITNASLTKSQANKLASILHDAYARAIKPVHGTLDGDTVFVLSTGKQQVNFDAFAALATDVMQYAIIDGALSAEGAYGLPAAKDMQ